jgi:hypothetical protein
MRRRHRMPVVGDRDAAAPCELGDVGEQLALRPFDTAPIG